MLAREFIALLSLTAGFAIAQEVPPAPQSPTVAPEFVPKSDNAIPLAPALKTVEAPPHAAFVFEMTGQWIGPGDTPVPLGAALMPGEKLRPKSPGAAVSIVTVAGSIIQRKCPNAGDCGEVEIPKPSQLVSEAFARMLEGMGKIVADTKVAPTASVAESPQHGVLLGDGKVLHFGASVQDLGEGEYNISLTRIESGALVESGKIEFTWSTRLGPVEPVGLIRPGMYRMRVAPVKGKLTLTAVDVLVLGRREYNRYWRTYEEARQVSSSWQTDPASIRNFQVLVLYGLDSLRPKASALP